MTPLSRRSLRPVTLAAAIACCASLAPAVALAAPRALTVEVRADTPEIDATALSEAVADELAGPDDEAPSPLKIVVWVDHETNELVVELRNKGLRISRRVPAPADPVELKRIAVFLIGNLARDQASTLLAGLRPASQLPAEEPPRAEARRAPMPVVSSPAPPAPHRLWIGLWGELDFADMRSAAQVCAQSGGGGASGSADDYCTSGGTDFTLPSSLSTQGDQVQGGLARGTTRALVSVDYAVTGNLLLGARVGYVFGTYRGQEAKQNGRAFPPLHLEARATYVFGDDPVFHAGVAPYVMASFGVAPWSARADVLVVSQSTPPPSPPQLLVQAWQLGGPGFISAGAGARFAFSGSAALLVGPRFTLAFGNAGALGALGPEVGLQLGF